MRATEAFSIANKGAGSYPVIPDGHGSDYLFGGRYQLDAHGTWGGGSLQAQQLGPDGTTWLSIGTAITADGGVTFDAPPGRYRLTVATATGVYATLTRVPVSE